MVGARNGIILPDDMKDAHFPFPVDIIDAVHTHILPLKGHSVARPNDKADLMRRAKLGV